MGRGLAGKALAAAAATVLLLAAADASAVKLQFGDFVLVADGSFKPSKLPERRDAPIVLRGNAKISTRSQKLPPNLRRLVVEYDRHASVQTAGLPVCRASRLASTTVPAARRRCGRAIVGNGMAHAAIEFASGQRIPVSSPITLFNGPRTRGFPTVLAHAYTTVPIRTTFVVPIVIEKIRRGEFGYRTRIDVPTIAGGAGTLIAGRLKIGRRWTHRGRRHSFVNARCEVGHLQVRGEFTFTDGTYVKGGLVKSCGVRH